MSFYLNRTGQPEGPYEDPVILQWIQSGQLREGSICPPGGNQWMPLHAHPPFAQALQMARGAAPATPSGYPPVPGGGYAPGPGGYPPAGPYGGGPGGAYGPGQAPWGHGPPGAAPGGYGPQGAAPSGPPQPVHASSPGAPPGRDAGRPAKKGSKGLIIGLLAGALLLVGGIVVAALFLLRSPGPQLSGDVPKDVEVYLEIPSVKRALLGFQGQSYIDGGKMDSKETADKVTEQLASAFDISKGDARDVAFAFDSYAVAARNFSKQPDAAMLFGFSSASAVEKLLASKRFTAQGTVGKHGKKYELKRKEVPADKLKDLPSAERAFVEMSAAGTRDTLVWFEESELLVLGEESFILDIASVIEGGKESLQKSAQYKGAAAKFEPGGAMVMFVDSSVLGSLKDPDQKKLLDGYFKNVEPFIGSVNFVSAGMLMNLRGTLSGDSVPKDETLTPAVSLKLSRKLPAETFGYVAFSSKSSLTGKQAEDLLVSNLGKADPDTAATVKEGLAKVEETLGFGLKTVSDAIGDQGVMAVIADKNYRFDMNKGPKDALGSLAVTWIQQLKDKPSAEKVVSILKQKLFDTLLKSAFKVTPDGVGFSAEPVQAGAGMPSIKVKFLDDHLFVSVGASALVERSLSAYKDGKDPLGDDGAHQSALGAMPGDAYVVVWTDTGRILDQLLKANPSVDAELAKRGFSPSAIRTSGKDRVTSAMAFSMKAKSGVWEYRIDTLNLAAAAPIAMVSELVNPTRGGGDSDGVPDLGATAGDIGIQECDDYQRKMAICIEKMPPSLQLTMRDAMVKTGAAWKTAAAFPASRPSLATSCKSMLDGLSKNPYCK